MKTDAFRDQVVIVTGAPSGIGRLLALLLAGQRVKVALAARRTERLEFVAEECHQHGGKALVVPANVSDEPQCAALVEKTVAEFGRLDMLVNVQCTYYALPYLKQSNGRIVAVSSLGGKLQAPYNSAYVSSKFAMHGFFDSLRIELIRHGVSVIIICPYWVLTGFHEAQMDKDGVPRWLSGQGIYNKKMMTADHCAEVVLQAAYKRKRELVMGPGNLIVWLKLFAPDLVDRLMISLLKAAVQREQQNASQL